MNKKHLSSTPACVLLRQSSVPVNRVSCQAMKVDNGR